MEIITAVPITEYRTIPFSLIYQFISNSFWLNEDFSLCYRFIAFPSNSDETNHLKRLEIITASNPDIVQFDQYYSVEFDNQNETLYIYFCNERYKVENLKVYFEGINAMILHLVDMEDVSHLLYSANTDPFSSRHKKLYGVKK